MVCGSIKVWIMEHGTYILRAFRLRVTLKSLEDKHQIMVLLDMPNKLYWLGRSAQPSH